MCIESGISMFMPACGSGCCEDVEDCATAAVVNRKTRSTGQHIRAASALKPRGLDTRTRGFDFMVSSEFVWGGHCGPWVRTCSVQCTFAKEQQNRTRTKS